MSVYLIHLDRPLKHATHYVGFATYVMARLQRHRAGDGSRFMAVVQEAGIPWRLARVWRGRQRNFERQIKKRNYGPIAGLCPVCCRRARMPVRRLRTLAREVRARKRQNRRTRDVQG